MSENHRFLGGIEMEHWANGKLHFLCSGLINNFEHLLSVEMQGTHIAEKRGQINNINNRTVY